MEDFELFPEVEEIDPQDYELFVKAQEEYDPVAEYEAFARAQREHVFMAGHETYASSYDKNDPQIALEKDPAFLFGVTKKGARIDHKGEVQPGSKIFVHILRPKFLILTIYLYTSFNRDDMLKAVRALSGKWDMCQAAVDERLSKHGQRTVSDTFAPACAQWTQYDIRRKFHNAYCRITRNTELRNRLKKAGLVPGHRNERDEIDNAGKVWRGYWKTGDENWATGHENNGQGLLKLKLAALEDANSKHCLLDSASQLVFTRDLAASVIANPESIQKLQEAKEAVGERAIAVREALWNL